MPPWSFPSAFCNAINGSVQWTGTGGTDLKGAVPDGDYAFCTSWTIDVWQTCLYIGLAFWVFMTALNVLHSFEWGELSGYSLQRLLKVIAHQVGWLLAALASFYLLLLAHQFVYMIVRIFVSYTSTANIDSGPQGIPQWHTDAIWARYQWMLTDVQNHIVWDQSCHNGEVACTVSPPMDPSKVAFLGYTWDWVQNALGDLAGWLPSAILASRFVMMLIVIGTAPIAFIARCHQLTRGLFRHWLTFWLELEAMSLVGALGILVYATLEHPLPWDHLNDSNFAWENISGSTSQQLSDAYVASIKNANYIRLTLVALIGGAAIAFLVRAVGGFISNIIAYFTTQQHLENAETQRDVGIGIAVGELAVAAFQPELLPLAMAGGAAIGAGVQASQITSTPQGAGFSANGLASNLAGAGAQAGNIVEGVRGLPGKYRAISQARQQALTETADDLIDQAFVDAQQPVQQANPWGSNVAGWQGLQGTRDQFLEPFQAIKGDGEATQVNAAEVYKADLHGAKRVVMSDKAGVSDVRVQVGDDAYVPLATIEARQNTVQFRERLSFAKQAQEVVNAQRLRGNAAQPVMQDLYEIFQRRGQANLNQAVQAVRNARIDSRIPSVMYRTQRVQSILNKYK